MIPPPSEGGRWVRGARGCPHLTDRGEIAVVRASQKAHRERTRGRTSSTSACARRDRPTDIADAQDIEDVLGAQESR
jgi:hypothetical protein